MSATPLVTDALNWAPIVVVTILLLLAATVIVQIWLGKINISQLLSDGPGASLSRFQFFVFTFVVGFGYLMILCYEVIHNAASAEAATTAAKLVANLAATPGAAGAPNAAHAMATAAQAAPARIDLPDASGAAWLLGISAGGYALGKGIQTSGDTSKANALVASNVAASAAASLASGGAGSTTTTATTNPGSPGTGGVATTETTPT